MSAVEVVEPTNELAIVAQQSGLAENKVTVLLSKFKDSYQSALNIIHEAQDINVTSEDQKDDIEQAGIARKELKRLRCDVENTRKELKEQSLREGKAIDGMANIIKAVIVPVEQELEKHEKFAERLAAERFARKCAERQAKLAAYVEDPSFYKYESLSDEAFDQLIQQLVDTKVAKEAAEKKAQEEAEAERKKLEAERAAKEKAAAEEAERMRKENEKLKAEAAAREEEIAKKLEAEAKRQQAERLEQNRKIAAERAKAEEERQRREAIETAQREEAAAKAKAEAEAAEAQRQSLLAPDKEKLVTFAELIEGLQMPAVTNMEAAKLLEETKDFLTRIGKNLRQKATQL